VKCNPAKPYCPPGGTCVPVTETEGKCKSGISKQKKGFMEVCNSDSECLQEYFCEQTAYCIAPPPGSDKPLPDFCNQKNCVPQKCTEQKDCPDGSVCAPYDFKKDGSKIKTCVRDATEIPGGFGAKCDNNNPPCDSKQYFCQDACALAGVMCIIPVEVCAPMVCDPVKSKCPSGSECKDVGITDACVKK
jgi:hypothetical protein